MVKQLAPQSSLAECLERGHFFGEELLQWKLGKEII